MKSWVKLRNPCGALTGTNVSPSIFEIAAVLGKEETLGGLKITILVS